MDSSSIEFFYKNVVESSSDDDSDGDTEMIMTAASFIYDDMMRPTRRASINQRSANVDRERESGHARIYKDYFHPTDPIFKEATFRRRFRMSSGLFKRIRE